VLLEIEVNLGPSGKTDLILFSHPAPPAHHANGDQDQSQDKEDGQNDINNNPEVGTCDLNKEGYCDEEYDHEKSDNRDHGSYNRCPVVQGRGEFHLVRDICLVCPKILKERKSDNHAGTNSLYLKSL
jgi:hypothetical protein